MGRNRDSYLRDEHWTDEGQTTWDVKVGGRVRQCAIPDSPPNGWGAGVPPVGTLGTVTWIEDLTDASPEVWVRWDDVPYNGLEDSSMATWLEPAADD